MQQQHRILETISKPAGLARLSKLLAGESFPHRTAIAQRVCAAFGFHDARGTPQLSTCLKALRTLHARGSIELPPPLHPGGRGTPRLLGQPVPPPRAVPARVNEVRGLRLQLVRSADQRQIWNELVQREHPRGAACHVGAQLRYLLLSDHGILGALGFAAAALALADRDRDRFIGWDPDLRQRQLYRLANLSRFLIRPAVRCRNPASKALALCLRRLAADSRARYRYAPLLVETFVDRDRHDGTCFKAANWIPVGHTAGRGRHAPTGQRVPVKAVLLYPLRPDWRAALGVPPPLRPWSGLDQPDWAQLEFGDAPLGDRRLSRRLVTCAALSATAPGGRVGEGVTAPLPPQNRACASNALGSSHGSFALSRRSRLSMAVPCTGCRNSSFRPVSQPWPCTCDAGLSSDGSRRPRFPAVYGTMPALRPPARRPLDLFLRQPVPRFAC